MKKYLLPFTAMLTLWGQSSYAATSVETSSYGGALVYDANSSTITATNLIGNANFSSSSGPEILVGALATLTIGFAAPLVQTTEFQQIEWTGSGHRFVASFVRGTATSFEYVVNSLPDINGNSTNLLTVRSLSGFSVPYVSLSQLSYYYYSDGSVVPGGTYLHDPYAYGYNLSFLALFPPCNCSGSTFPKFPISAYSATSDIPGYVQNIYRQSNAFNLYHGSDSDLWQVRAPSVVLAGSFSELNSYMTWAPDVPEPASWAMMVAGFGMVGFAVRRRTAFVIA